MKKPIKEAIFQKRNSLSKEEIMARSDRIKENLFQLNEFKISKVVMFFVSFNNEVYTHSMIKESLKSKIVAVPKIINKEIEPSLILDFNQLIPNKYGILEPIDVTKISQKSIQIVLVPGIVFDKEGHRIGYGFGYYDRFLSKINPIKTIKIGLAFDFQVIGKIPQEMHDIAVDLIVTDKEVIYCSV